MTPQTSSADRMFSRAGRCAAVIVVVVNVALVVVGFVQHDPAWQIGFRIFIAAVFGWLLVDRRVGFFRK